jgi:predicted ABC-type sugar transport system permease subunit
MNRSQVLTLTRYCRTWSDVTAALTNDWRRAALLGRVSYLRVLVLVLAGLGILLFCALILTRLTTCTYNVGGQLDGARYLSRARFTSKIDHVTNKQELGGGSGGLGPIVGSFWGF